MDDSTHKNPIHQVKYKKILKYICYIAIGYIFFPVILGIYEDGFEDLGGGYIFYDEAGNAILGPQVYVPPFIANFNYDKRFIIAKQVLYGIGPNVMCSKHNYNYKSLTGDFYWIIDKPNKNYYGPLDFEEFKVKCDSLNVTIELSPQDKFECPSLKKVSSPIDQQ